MSDVTKAIDSKLSLFGEEKPTENQASYLDDFLSKLYKKLEPHEILDEFKNSCDQLKWGSSYQITDKNNQNWVLDLHLLSKEVELTNLMSEQNMVVAIKADGPEFIKKPESGYTGLFVGVHKAAKDTNYESGRVVYTPKKG